MKMNEVFGNDDNSAPDEHQQKIARIMQSMQKQYGGPERPRGPSSEEVQRRQEVTAKRQEAEQSVAQIAKSFRPDQYNDFVAAVNKQLPLASKLVDLQTMFSIHGSGQSDTWSDFAKNRELGLGPTGNRNWAGD